MTNHSRAVRSSLARVLGRSPANQDEIWSLRRRAWRETGVVVVRPEEVNDPFARQALVNAAEKLFGPRPKPPHDKPIDGAEGAR